MKLLRTVPSALSGTATGVGYSRDVTTLLALAQYIRNLGYQAYASMNDTALSIPMAIQAGLGEYGRHGLLITKEFGPRVRIGKIFTDLPLAHDKPIQFGVKNSAIYVGNVQMPVHREPLMMEIKQKLFIINPIFLVLRNGLPMPKNVSISG
ncbi:MAG: hypothetical protein CM1200mP10_08650 [Candidatus Neomarinimicrobiota bacterium]|nr:MAG: hypothetical protein CM1200mP10_08650 [Candidatus Neomarinimicrobiota bacterium]